MLPKKEESYERFLNNLSQEMAKKSLTSIIDYICNSENNTNPKPSKRKYDSVSIKNDIKFKPVVKMHYPTVVQSSRTSQPHELDTLNLSSKNQSMEISSEKSNEQLSSDKVTQTEVSKEILPVIEKSSEEPQEVTSEKFNETYKETSSKESEKEHPSSFDLEGSKDESQKKYYSYDSKTDSTYDLPPSKPTLSESIYTMVPAKPDKTSIDYEAQKASIDYEAPKTSIDYEAPKTSIDYGAQPSKSSEYFVPMLKHPSCPDHEEEPAKKEIKENYYSLSVLIPDQFSDLLPSGPCTKKVIYCKPSLKITEEEEYLFYCGQPNVTESQLLLNVVLNMQDKPKQMYPIPICHIAAVPSEIDLSSKSSSVSSIFEEENATSPFFSERFGSFNLALHNCKKLICPKTDGECINSWLLTEVSHWDTESEKMVILTENSLFSVKYDFINHRIKYHRRVRLCQLTEVIKGDMRYPRTSFMPYIHDCFEFLAENVVKNVNTLIRSGYKPLKRISPIAVCLKWNKKSPEWYQYLWNWNPWSEAPWMTLISHPLVYRHQNTHTTSKDVACSAMAFGEGEHQTTRKNSEPHPESNIYDVSHFHSILEGHLKSQVKGKKIKFLQQPIIIENYLGLLSTFHNMYSLGYNKCRGKFSF